MTTAPDTDDQLRTWMVNTADRYGAAVLHIDGEGTRPSHAFSAGVWRRFGKPEVVVIGLPQEVAHTVVNTYVGRCGSGEKFLPGRLYEGFLNEQPVTFERVAKPYYPEFLASAMLLHGHDFPALQLVLPTPEVGTFSWQQGAPAGFAKYQPLLTESGLPESWTPGHDGV